MGGKGAERSAARAIRALKGSIRVELFSHSGFYLVAVGTIIADRPPHRTVRAALPHTAPTLEGWREVLLLAHRSILGTLVPRTVSGECGTDRCSPYEGCTISHSGDMLLLPLITSRTSEVASSETYGADRCCEILLSRIIDDHGMPSPV